MSVVEFTPAKSEVIYSERDGNPISDHTLQFEWIVLIKSNLDALFAADPDVFVAGDLLWYPVEGDNRTRIAPDALVAFGRPKGQRGSYRQWDENGVIPQVVFEILSPGNRFGEMLNKFLFYQRYGVEEYYLYDPFKFAFDVWLRDPNTNTLELQDATNGWLSPRLGVKFVPNPEAPLEIYAPGGFRFRSFVEIRQAQESAEHRAETAEERAAQLAARLRELGIDPDTV